MTDEEEITEDPIPEDEDEATDPINEDDPTTSPEDPENDR